MSPYCQVKPSPDYLVPAVDATGRSTIIKYGVPLIKHQALELLQAAVHAHFDGTHGSIRYY